VVCALAWFFVNPDRRLHAGQEQVTA
jgi:hypothetical protein